MDRSTARHLGTGLAMAWVLLAADAAGSGESPPRAPARRPATQSARDDRRAVPAVLQVPPIQVPAPDDAPPPDPSPAPAQPMPRTNLPDERGATTEETEREIQVGADGRITLHMDDLDVRRALELLSREGGLNIMVSPAVTGRVTANLERATVDQTLAAILRLGNLTARRENGLIYVYAPDDLKNQSTYNQEMGTRVYRLNYIRSNDLTAMVTKLLSPSGTMSSTPESAEGINDSPTLTANGTAGSVGGGGGGPGRGTSGGNSLSGGDVVIVRDYENHLRTIDEIVRKLDVAPIQVMVEAVIVSVELNRTRELGVNYSAVDDLGTSLGTIGNGAELAANSGFTPAKLLSVPIAGANAAARAASGRINGGAAPGGLNSTTNGIKFGFVSDNNAAFIRALETMGETRVLASPRLLVLNKQKAEIQLGQRLGYSTTSQTVTSVVQSVQFLNTGTLLRLRPFISSDGVIRMEIHPERSTGVVVGGVPNSSTAEVTTNVMIPNGKTLVIGGLIENEDSFNYQGLPGLNKVPVVGTVFGYRNRNKVKRELIVMLTPHIMENCATPPPGTDPAEIESVSTPGPDPEPGPAARNRATPPPAPLPPPRNPALDPNDFNYVPPGLREVYPSAAPAGSQVDRQVHTASLEEPPPRAPAPAPKPAPAPTPAPAPAAGGARHTVAEGENYWTISRLHYKTGRYYLALWGLNHKRGERPEQLRIGDVLRIPSADALDPALVVDPRTNRMADGSGVDEVVDAALRRESGAPAAPARTPARKAPAPAPTPARAAEPEGNAWRPAAQRSAAPRR